MVDGSAKKVKRHILIFGLSNAETGVKTWRKRRLGHLG